MSTSFEFVGQGDSSGQWVPSSSVYYAGPKERVFPYIGQDDYLGQWFSAAAQYLSPPIRPCFWVGQRDANGDWMDSNAVYLGQPIFSGSMGNPLQGGLITWMKAIYMFTRDWWPVSLATPYAGQLWPIGGGASPGGAGQTFPW